MMYFIIPVLLIGAVHPLSFAKFNWKKKNKMAAVGMVLLTLAAIAYPCILILIR